MLWLPLSSETFQVKKRDVEIFGSQPRPNSLLLRAVAADGAYETRAAPFFRSVLPVASACERAPAGGSAAQEYAAAKAVLRAAVTPTSAVLRDLPL